MPEPLDSARDRSCRLRWGRPALCLLGVAVVFAAPFVSVRQTRSRVDEVTGSIEWMTKWPMGITSGPRVEPSALELRLNKMGVHWTRKWSFLHNTHRTLLGAATMYECGGPAPPIYSYRCILEPFVQKSSDPQVRALAQVMQSGTPEQQATALEAAADVGLKMD